MKECYTCYLLGECIDPKGCKGDGQNATDIQLRYLITEKDTVIISTEEYYELRTFKEKILDENLVYSPTYGDHYYSLSSVFDKIGEENERLRNELREAKNQIVSLREKCDEVYKESVEKTLNRGLIDFVKLKLKIKHKK